MAFLFFFPFPFLLSFKGLVGLPARGKTYIGQKLSRYLRWLGITTRVFNVGDYRRKYYGAEHSHEFFDPKNTEATAMRMEAASIALKDMIQYVKAGSLSLRFSQANFLLFLSCSFLFLKMAQGR